VSRVDVRALRRSQILEAAQRLVAEKGWAATTYADICREAGISNGVLTYHFKSKEDIRFALFELELERWRVEFQLEERISHMSAPERARYALEKTAQTLEKRPEFYQTLLYYLANTPLNRPDLQQRIRDFFTEVRGHIAKSLSDAMDSGMIDRRDPYEMASVLQSIIYGYALARVAIGIEPPLDDLIKLVTGYLNYQQPAPAETELQTALD
jgi:AcrR family transcriptional regulator